MKNFGTIVSAHDLANLQHTPAEGVYGLGVSAKRFLRHLLQRTDFSAYHFFVLGQVPELPEDHLLRSDSRISLLPAQALKTAFKSTDYGVFHNPWSPYIVPWLDLRNRFGHHNVPMTGITHTISYPMFLQRALSMMFSGLKPWDSTVCTSTAAVQVMSNWIDHVRDEFRTMTGLDSSYAGRLDRIPLGVDTASFFPREKPPLRDRLTLPQDHTIILCLGRFSPYDKMDLFPLLMAFKLALHKVGDRAPSTLVLAGSDSRHGYAKRVQSEIERLELTPSVQIRTDLSDAEVQELYAASDIFLSPCDNLQETFGQSIIEAMASGLAVVCSDWNGYRDLVVHGDSGYLVPTYWIEHDNSLADFAQVSSWMHDHFLMSQAVSVDIDQMVHYLVRLLTDPKLREQLGRNARQRAKALYAWPKVIDQYMALWRELHDMASSQPAPVPRRRSWSRPEFTRVFRHYPTTMLGPAHRVRTRGATDNGLRLTSEPRWYRELDDTLDGEVINTIMLKASQWTTIQELEEHLVTTHQLSGDLTRFHIMWLCKYHHLELES